MMDVWNDWMAYSKLYVKLQQRMPLWHRQKHRLNAILKKYDKDANKVQTKQRAFICNL